MGHNFVGTEHILLGLIGEGTGIAAKTLKSKGVTLKGARVEVEKIIGRGSGIVAVEIPFTPRAKRVLELAWDEARLLGHNYVDTQHLLLGILREGNGVAVAVLGKLGVDSGELRQAIGGATSPGKLSVEPVIPDLALVRAGFHAGYRRDAADVIDRAASAAELFGSKSVEPLHLLLGLLNEPGTIGDALQHVDADVAGLRRGLLNLVQPDKGAGPRPLAFSLECEQVLGNAWKQAYDLEQRAVTRESIFLGLLQQDEASPVKQVLRDAGIDHERLRAFLTEVADKDDVPEQLTSQTSQNVARNPRVALLFIVIATALVIVWLLIRVFASR